NWGAVACRGFMRICGDGGRRDLPLPNLRGHHQCWNAALAVVALQNQKLFTISDEAIEKGVQSAEWPGRLERVTQGRVAGTLPRGWELWYDGGHNDSGGEALGRFLVNWASEGPVHLVVGMLQSKDPVACLSPLLPFAETVSTFSFALDPFNQTGPSYEAAVLAQKLSGIGKDVRAYPSLKDAVVGVSHTGARGRILVTGTLYAYKDLF
ncbi:MAG TPA: hypothetical protein VGD95_08305, partial [Micavibrio sp.]